MTTVLIEQIKSDRNAAMKAGDQVTKGLLNILIGEIDRRRGVINPKTGEQVDIDDNVAADAVAKIIKGINENIVIAKDAGMEYTSFTRDLSIVGKYAPSILSEDATRQLVTDIVANGARNLGDVMKALAPQGKGIDKKLASSIAMELLK